MILNLDGDILPKWEVRKVPVQWFKLGRWLAYHHLDISGFSSLSSLFIPFSLLVPDLLVKTILP